MPFNPPGWHHKRSALIPAVMLLGACTIFYPRFDPLVAERTSKAYEQTSKLLSAAELGKYESASSYKDAVDEYAAIDSALSLASLRVSTAAAPTRLSTEARDGIKNQIDQCKSQVRALAGIHKETGIPVDAGAIQPVRNACDQAARSAEAMK